MQRRELFKFLAVAPVALTTAIVKEEENVTVIKLPQMAVAGEMMTFVNTGKNWVAIR